MAEQAAEKGADRGVVLQVVLQVILQVDRHEERQIGHMCYQNHTLHVCLIIKTEE